MPILGARKVTNPKIGWLVKWMMTFVGNPIIGNYYSSPHVGKLYFQKVGLPINLHIFPTWGFP